MLSGTVFDIQRLCVHDGPGIRTTVFLKGCSLHCFWCHNPESIQSQKQLMIFRDKCIGCGRCVDVCPSKAHRFRDQEHLFDRNRCTGCGACALACPAKALKLSGNCMTAEQVMQEIRKDISFYKTSGGGVTFSGGEPLLQARFLEELLYSCRENGIHTAIETAGNVPWENVECVLPLTGLFLYDLKVMDPRLHRQFTGSGNQRCLANLKRLAEQNVPLRVRIPVIPTVNDTEAAMVEIQSFLRGLARKVEIELLPFHKWGLSKYNSLDIPYQAETFSTPEPETMKRLYDIVHS